VLHGETTNWRSCEKRPGVSLTKKNKKGIGVPIGINHEIRKTNEGIIEPSVKALVFTQQSPKECQNQMWHCDYRK